MDQLKGNIIRRTLYAISFIFVCLEVYFFLPFLNWAEGPKDEMYYQLAYVSIFSLLFLIFSIIKTKPLAGVRMLLYLFLLPTIIAVAISWKFVIIAW